MRGTAGCFWRLQGSTRIIPACAGNSYGNTQKSTKVGDHPRVCGEQKVICCAFSILSGSSPRVRGTEICNHKVNKTIGIIPACAGNRAGRRHALGTCWDHPRVCGEQKSRLVTSRVVEGSSPRVRGTGQSLTSKYSKAGIIPACAGNRQRVSLTRKARRDHPRVCGEQRNLRGKMSRREGSSPRVRGTVHL